MLLALSQYTTDTVEKKIIHKNKEDFSERNHKELQIFMIFGNNSKYLGDPDLLITEIEHSIKDYNQNPRQGIFLLRLSSFVGQKLIDKLLEFQSLSSKQAATKINDLRELAGASCNILNYVITATDNASIFSRDLTWAPKETIEDIRVLKINIFSLFGCLSKFSDDIQRIDWFGFSDLSSRIISSYELVRRDTEKQNRRIGFYLGKRSFNNPM